MTREFKAELTAIIKVTTAHEFAILENRDAFADLK
jgi:hypothetical protein